MSLRKSKDVPGLEETHSFRTSMPLSGTLINGAPVTCKRGSLYETMVIFSLPQSINIQQPSFIMKNHVLIFRNLHSRTREEIQEVVACLGRSHCWPVLFTLLSSLCPVPTALNPIKVSKPHLVCSDVQTPTKPHSFNQGES